MIIMLVSLSRAAAGQLRWAFAYSGSLPLYLLIQNNILFGVLGK